MSLEENLNLIFIPGLSTKEEVTDVSGRGIGMDVIKSEINNVGGDIVVTSEEDYGTKFSINLPIFGES